MPTDPAAAATTVTLEIIGTQSPAAREVVPCERVHTAEVAEAGA